jgi:hypothetical protein
MVAAEVLPGFWIAGSKVRLISIVMIYLNGVSVELVELLQTSVLITTVTKIGLYGVHVRVVKTYNSNANNTYRLRAVGIIPLWL